MESITAIIRKVKGSQKYALCFYKGTTLVPEVVSPDYDFLVGFCKAENYTWYFNLAEDKAVEIN